MFERSLVRGPVAASAFLLFLSVMILPVYYVIGPTVLDRAGLYDAYKANLTRSDLRHLSPMVYDQQSRFVIAPRYYAPTQLEPVAAYFGWEPSGKSNQDDDENGPDYHGKVFNTNYVSQPNPHFVDCLMHLEDRYFDSGIWQYHGLDLRGLGAAITSGASKGGSTLTAQVQQQLGGKKASAIDQSAPFLDRAAAYVGKLDRKLSEILFRTPATSRWLAAQPDGYNRAIARTMPHIRGVGGKYGLAHGLNISSQLYFGVDQAELSRAQAYFIASTTKRHPRFRIYDPGEDQRWAEADRQYDEEGKPTGDREYLHRTFVRAHSVCAPALVEDDAELEAVQSELASIAGPEQPRPLPILDSDGTLDNLGEALSVATGGDPEEWYLSTRNPEEGGRKLVPMVTQGIMTEFRQAFDEDWGPAVQRVNLSVDAVDHHRFHRQFDQRIRDWFALQRRRGVLNPCYFSYAEGERPVDANRHPECTGDHGDPEIAIAFADENSKIVRYYANGENQIYWGNFANGTGDCFRMTLRNYNYNCETRQLASVSKIGAAIIFARLEQDSARYRSAVTRSNSDTVTALLNQITPTTLENMGDDVRTSLNWSDGSSRQARGVSDNYSESLSKGTLTASPRTVHHGMASLLQGLTGNPAPVRAPTLVGSVNYLDYPSGAVSESANRLPDYVTLLGKPMSILDTDRELLPAGEFQNRVDQALSDPAGSINVLGDDSRATIDRLRTLLRGPVCEPGGTLRYLRSRGWCSTERARLIFAKTGTYDRSVEYTGTSGRNITQAIWIAGGIQMASGRRFSFVLTISGRNKSTPLATPNVSTRNALNASNAADLIDFILEDLEANPPLQQ